MTLQHPKRFAAQAIVFRIILVQAGDPLFHGRRDDFRRPVAQLATRAVARARLVLPKLVEQLGFTFAVLRYWLEQRLLCVNESIDPAALVIAVGITLRVLHVTNERIAPIAEPKCAVG